MHHHQHHQRRAAGKDDAFPIVGSARSLSPPPGPSRHNTQWVSRSDGVGRMLRWFFWPLDHAVRTAATCSSA